MLFTLSLRTGGSEQQLVYLAKALDREQFSVKVITLLPDHTRLRDDLIAVGIPVYSDMFVGPLGYLVGIFRLAHFLRKEHVQIVHTYLMLAYLFSFSACVLAGVHNRIASERASRRPIWPASRAWLYRLVIPWTQYLEVNSEAVRQILIEDEHINPSKLVLHRNALDFSSFELPPSIPDEAWIKDGHLRIGVVANVYGYKNLILLARAMSELILQYPILDLVHVGRKIQEPAYTELYDYVSNHLGDHWIALGQRDDVPAVLRRIDIFALSSDVEGTSNALLEAMASGLPVVTTDVGDCKAILQESGGGFVVPVRDRQALVVALSQLIDNPVLRRQMGEANRAWVMANCQPARLAREVEAMYRSLLAKRTESGI